MSMTKSLFILPMGEVVHHHTLWLEMLKVIGVEWSEVVELVVGPLLDDINRGGLDSLEDEAIINYDYIDELTTLFADSTFKGDEEQLAEYRDSSSQVIMQMMRCLQTYIPKVMASSTIVNGFPSSISVHRLIDYDLVLEVHYVLYDSLPRPQQQEMPL
jgi:hypothetical protein